MLYENTVAPATLGLLKELMQMEELQPVEIVHGIRFASMPDIAAMKLNAITRRGNQKDYFDLSELLDHYSLSEMLQFFTDKYTVNDIGFVIRSLVYFEEANRSKDPIMLKNITWQQVKDKIERAVQDYWKG